MYRQCQKGCKAQGTDTFPRPFGRGFFYEKGLLRFDNIACDVWQRRHRGLAQLLDILNIVAPVFLVVGAGYVAVWLGLFADSAVDGLMVFTQKFAIPCLLFAAMAQLELSVIFDVRVVLSYFGSAIACFVIAATGARIFFARPLEDCIAIGFAALFANTVLLGLPISESAYGAASLSANFSIIAFNAAICYFIGITSMEILRAGGIRQRVVMTVLSAMFRNSIMLGIALGLLVNMSGFPVPQAVSEAVDLLRRAALPAALFGLGGVIYRYKPEGDARTIIFLCVITLLVQPALAYLAAASFELTKEQLRAVVVTAAMAPGINAYIFADMYGVARRVVASSVLFGTAFTVLTAAFWLTLLP